MKIRKRTSLSTVTTTAAVIVAFLATQCDVLGCYWVKSFYRQPSSCGCSDLFAGSGSCYSSVAVVPSNVPEQKCAPVDSAHPSGKTVCSQSEYVQVAVEFGCGDNGYNTGAVVLCAIAYTGLTAAAIAAILATGGIAAVLALLSAEVLAGATAIAACTWCSLHICGIPPGDPGTAIWGYKKATLSGTGCSYNPGG